MAFPNEKVDTEILKRRSCALIWSLPAELLLHLFKGLQIKDLLNLRSVSSLSTPLSTSKLCALSYVFNIYVHS